MVSVIVVIVLVGVLLYCANTFIPMDAKVRRILNIVVVIALVLWLLNVFGVFTYLDRAPAIGPGRR